MIKCPNDAWICLLVRTGHYLVALCQMYMNNIFSPALRLCLLLWCSILTKSMKSPSLPVYNVTMWQRLTQQHANRVLHEHVSGSWICPLVLTRLALSFPSLSRVCFAQINHQIKSIACENPLGNLQFWFWGRCSSLFAVNNHDNDLIMTQSMIIYSS